MTILQNRQQSGENNPHSGNFIYGNIIYYFFVKIEISVGYVIPKSFYVFPRNIRGIVL